MGVSGYRYVGRIERRDRSWVEKGKTIHIAEFRYVIERYLDSLEVFEEGEWCRSQDVVQYDFRTRLNELSFPETKEMNRDG